jgi:hypothetical protein
MKFNVVPHVEVLSSTYYMFFCKKKKTTYWEENKTYFLYKEKGYLTYNGMKNLHYQYHHHQANSKTKKKFSTSQSP